LAVLLPHIERDANITYYAISKEGDLRTNTYSDGPNAVTWGVFPGKEIIQPTIVEAISFMAWKVRGHPLTFKIPAHQPTQDEAYELGFQWAKFYDHGSPARKLITDYMGKSLLVNVVHNDFKDPLAIFDPFFKAAADYAAQHPTATANGHAQ